MKFVKINARRSNFLSKGKGFIFNLRNIFNEKQSEDKICLAERFKPVRESVWDTIIKLNEEYKPSVDLSSSSPDYLTSSYFPSSLMKTAKKPCHSVHNQAREQGSKRLVCILSKLFSPLFNRELDPMKEIFVSTGGYGCVFFSIFAHVEEGDEVILLEPYFEAYYKIVKAAGGIPVCVPLIAQKKEQMTGDDWKIDVDNLQCAFSEKTKAILVNNPLNPIGKVFTLEELLCIANLCKKWNVLCVSDEVYEWTTFEPYKHVKIADLPGMWERTITIGSLGKMFGMSGWKLGWMFGPSNLLSNVYYVHEFSINSSCHHLQLSVAHMLESELGKKGSSESFFKSYLEELIKKRDCLCQILSDAGFLCTIPGGGYYITADCSSLEEEIDLNLDKYLNSYDLDLKITVWLVKNTNVLGLPLKDFYCPQHVCLGNNYIRFCFLKRDETIQKAGCLLKKWRDNFRR